MGPIRSRTSVARRIRTCIIIVNHYHTLADVTVFLQGNPAEHVPDLFEKICSLDSLTDYRDLGDDVRVENGNGYPPQPGLPLASFHRKPFNEPPAPL